jgi:D-alanyl-D-alanine dipeptidase
MNVRLNPARIPGNVAGAILLIFCLCAPLGAQAPSLLPGPKPADVPAPWKGLIGEYGPEGKMISVLEKDGHLHLLFPASGETPLEQLAPDSFVLANRNEGRRIVKFTRNSAGAATQISVNGKEFPRRWLGPEDGQFPHATPVRPVEELRKEALALSPPKETGALRKPELVELASLDPTIRLDIRYATSNDFLGTPVYTQARAFLQRPAAEALLRAHRKLHALGYGLLIHDGYRPWYVTRIFWEATPPKDRIFVADPTQGSRHNRGCAVDLTLYDLQAGKPIEMPGTYDEASLRSFPNYPGGTSLQRWHRELLRRAMESEGFAVYEYEWWHFDYKDWHEYPILNTPFEEMGALPEDAPAQ